MNGVANLGCFYIQDLNLVSYILDPDFPIQDPEQ
jgi:hypothetical protein